MSVYPKLREHIEAAQWFYAIGKQNLNTDWQLRKVKSVGARPRVLGRPWIDATDMVVGDDFTVWSAHRRPTCGSFRHRSPGVTCNTA